MVLDSEKQRKILVQLIQVANFTGASVDDLFYLKLALTAAEIKSPVSHPTIVYVSNELRKGVSGNKKD